MRSAGDGRPLRPEASCGHRITPPKEFHMAKYLLAWLLGVPGIVLVLIWLFMH